MIIAILVLLIFPFISHALRRIDGHVPILHSVLDDKRQATWRESIRTSLVGGNEATGHDPYYKQPGAPQDGNGKYDNLHRQQTAKRFVVAGSFLSVGGSLLLLSSANGNSSQAASSNVIFGVILAAGVTLLITGILLNSRSGKKQKS